MATHDARPFTTPVGGVMTKEVGAITGPVEAWIEGGAVKVRYEGALDTYTVGAAKDRTLPQIVAILTSDPGVDNVGNPLPTTLS